MSEIKKIHQCPTCGYPVFSIFDHIAIDCDHEMGDEEIAALEAEAEEECLNIK